MRQRLLSILCLCLLASISFANPKRGEIRSSKDSGVDEFSSEGGYEGKVVWGKMVGTIPAPPHLVFEIFTDADEWPKIGIPRLIDSRLVNRTIADRVRASRDVDDFYSALGEQIFSVHPLRRKGDVWEHFQFQYFNVPWPVANRWMILDMKDIETGSVSGVYRVEWKLAAGNLKSMDGYIQFEPYRGDPKKTRLEYYVRTDPGSSVPKFLVRWGVQKAMPKTIEATRREAIRRLTPSSEKSPNSSGN